MQFCACLLHNNLACLQVCYLQPPPPPDWLARALQPIPPPPAQFSCPVAWPVQCLIYMQCTPECQRPTLKAGMLPTVCRSGPQPPPPPPLAGPYTPVVTDAGQARYGPGQKVYHFKKGSSATPRRGTVAKVAQSGEPLLPYTLNHKAGCRVMQIIIISWLWPSCQGCSLKGPQQLVAQHLSGITVNWPQWAVLAATAAHCRPAAGLALRHSKQACPTCNTGGFSGLLGVLSSCFLAPGRS